MERVLSVVFLGSFLLVSSSACISEPTRCTCSQQKFEGQCTRPVGNGKCIMTSCRQAMRCDCFGYEICSISPCGGYAALPGLIASQDKEFDCAFQPASLQCLESVEVLSTVDASATAKEASIEYLDAVVYLKKLSTESLQRSLQHYSDAISIVRKVELNEDEIDPETLQNIRRELDNCHNALQAAQKHVHHLFGISEVVFQAMKESKINRKASVNADTEVESLESQVKEAELQARVQHLSSSSECERLQRLVLEKKTIRDTTAASSTRAAKSARQEHEKGREIKDRILDAEQEIATAASRCKEMSKAIIPRRVARSP